MFDFETTEFILCGKTIHQRTDNNFISCTDVLPLIYEHRLRNGKDRFTLQDYLRSNKTKAFIKQIEEVENIKVWRISAGGRGQHTWLHPYVWLDFTMYGSPALRIELITMGLSFGKEI